MGGENPRETYCMIQSAKLHETKLEKDLGIHTDPELNFSQHCENRSTKETEH